MGATGTYTALSHEANDNKSARPDLAELARESDKIRLKQVEEESRQLPSAPAEEPDELSLPAPAPVGRTSAPARAGTRRKAGYSKPPSLPGGVYFVLSLVVIVLFATAIQSRRAELTASATSALRPLIGL